jgi:hypothetical protein
MINIKTNPFYSTVNIAEVWRRMIKMAQQVKSKVPFILENVSKCLCPGCPVQGKSQCVAGLKSGLNEALKRNPLKHDEIPGVYCGAGKATCPDLDASQNCLCGGCNVFTSYKLANSKPVGYYCAGGVAH